MGQQESQFFDDEEEEGEYGSVSSFVTSSEERCIDDLLRYLIQTVEKEMSRYRDASWW